MTNKSQSPSDQVAKTALELIREAIDKINTKKSSISELHETHTKNSAGAISRSTNRDSRLRYEREELGNSVYLFETLIRRTSQLLEHGQPPNSALQFELEFRLAELEHLINTINAFLFSTDPDFN